MAFHPNRLRPPAVKCCRGISAHDLAGLPLRSTTGVFVANKLRDIELDAFPFRRLRSRRRVDKEKAMPGVFRQIVVPFSEKLRMSCGSHPPDI